MMTDLFRGILFVGVLLFFVAIILLMRKGKMSLKYSLVWFLAGVVLLILAVFPQIVQWVTGLLGIYSDTNAVFFIGIGFLLFIILSLTSIVSVQSEQLRRLTQTQAVLEKRVRDMEQKIADDNDSQK